MTRLQMVIIFLLVITASLLRLGGIARGDFAFTFDMGRDLLAVRDLIFGGKLSLLGPTTGQLGLYYGPWWYWLLTPPFLISAGNPTGIAASIAILGIGSAILAFWWGLKFGGIWFATVLALILAASADIVSFTSQIWSPDLLIPLTLTLAILLSRVSTLSRLTLLAVGFLLGLAVELEAVYGLIFLLALVVAVVVWYRASLSTKKLVLILAGALMIEVPRLIFELRHDFVQTRSLFSGVGGEWQWGFHGQNLQFLWGNLAAVIPAEAQWGQWLLVLTLGGMLVILWPKYSARQQKFMAALLTIVGVFWLATAFYPKGFWSYYLMGLPVIYALLLALIMAQAIRRWRGGTLIFLGLYFLYVIKPIEVVKGLINPPVWGNAAVFRNQLAVIDYVYGQAQGEFKYIAYTPPQIDHTWQYLFWWYGNKKYHYTPSEAKWEKMFVIIEPDPGYELRIVDWLKVREHDGVVVAEKRFDSGIVVQTRLPKGQEP